MDGKRKTGKDVAPFPANGAVEIEVDTPVREETQANRIVKELGITRSNTFELVGSKGRRLRVSGFTPTKLLAALEQSLGSITEEVLYGDERGFQGALLHELQVRLGRGVSPEDPIIQQEYQKRMRHHGIKIRPDIIVHVPFERGTVEGRDKGNFVAIELKRRATAKAARQALASLAQIKEALKYPLTVLINVDSAETHARLCPASIADQTVCFAVRLQAGVPVVKAERYSEKAKTRVASE
jgi:hypothetical protein